MDIPEKCNKCIHRLKGYCRAYGAEISILNVDKCTRKDDIPKKCRKCSKRKDRYCIAHDIRISALYPATIKNCKKGGKKKK